MRFLYGSIFFLILIIFAVDSFALNESTTSESWLYPKAAGISDTIDSHERGETNFIMQNAHHELPTNYLIDEPAGAKRKGVWENLMLSVASAFRSQYISRDLPCSNGAVWQPEGTIELYGAGLNIWSNFVLDKEPNQGQFNEVDFTLYYNIKFGPMTFHPYVMYIVFPHANPESLDYSSEPCVETNFLITIDIWKLSIFDRTRIRVKNPAGTFWSQIGISYYHPIINDVLRLGVSPYFTIVNDNYSKKYFGVEGPNVDAMGFVFSVPYTPIHSLTLKPNMMASWHVTPAIRSSMQNNSGLSTYYIWGGLDVAYSF